MRPCTTSLPLVPENQTHLYYTDAYKTFNDEEKLCYNQLFGLMVCEQFYVFETLLLEQTIQRLQQTNNGSVQHKILDPIHKLHAEEIQHSAMFRSYLQNNAPNLYATNTELHFIRLNKRSRLMVSLLCNRFLNTHAILWYNLFIEDHGLCFAESLMNHQGNTLDPDYVTLHRRHYRDEVHHVSLDEEIIHAWYDQQSNWRKKLDMIILNQWLNMMRCPRLAACEVIRILCSMHPRLASQQSRLCTLTRGLVHHKIFQRHFLSESSCPRFWAALARRPETRRLRQKQESFL